MSLLMEGQPGSTRHQNRVAERSDCNTYWQQATQRALGSVGGPAGAVAGAMLPAGPALLLPLCVPQAEPLHPCM